MPAADRRSGAHSSSVSPRRSSSDTASIFSMISSGSSSGSPYMSEAPSRFMRAPVDSIERITRALTFSRARSSSSWEAGFSRMRCELVADDAPSPR